MGNLKTRHSEQDILNMATDDSVAPAQLTVGIKQYHPSGGYSPFPIANIYPYCQMDYTSGSLDYYGVNASASAADGATDWVIFKFTYDVSSNITKIQSAVGTWTGRAALFP